LKITLSRHGVTAVPPLAAFPGRNLNRSIIRSLTPQQAEGNALAIAVQRQIIDLQVNRLQNRLCFESPTTRRAGGLDFSAIGGKRQRHGSALIGAGVTVDARAKRPV